MSEMITEKGLSILKINDYILSLRYTCPFVEKFSIDIETYYKPDTGNQADVFNMSSAEKRLRTVGKNTASTSTLKLPDRSV